MTSFFLDMKSSESASGQEADEIFQPPDLRKVTIMKKVDWIRIQDELSGDDENQRELRKAAKRREALHLQSQELVKKMPNTIASQSKKILEAKKIQEQAEEENRKLIDIEEAKYKKREQQEALERAKTQLFYQTNQVKRLHSALLLTNVLKENEAQIELKKKMETSNKDREKKFLEMAKIKMDAALRQEQETILQKKLDKMALAEDLKKQMKEKELTMEQHKLETKKDADKIWCFQERYQQEQRMKSEQQQAEKKNIKQSHQEILNTRALITAQERAKEEAEEKQRLLFVSEKQKMMKLRKEREKEVIRESQLRSERILNQQTSTQKQTVTEEQKIANVLAEWDAKQAQLQQQEERKKSEILKSITAHRESMRKVKEHKDKIAKEERQNALLAMREAEIIFSEQQQLQAERIREEQRQVKEFNTQLVAERNARLQQLKLEEQEFQTKTEKLIAEEKDKFQQYSLQLINKATEAKKVVFPLHKAAREHEPRFDRIGSSYLACDSTGTPLPRYVNGTTRNVKKLHHPEDFQKAKRRLGFTQ